MEWPKAEELLCSEELPTDLDCASARKVHIRPDRPFSYYWRTERTRLEDYRRPLSIKGETTCENVF